MQSYSNEFQILLVLYALLIGVDYNSFIVSCYNDFFADLSRINFELETEYFSVNKQLFKI